MKVLLLGSGGREHALAWKLSQSPLLSQLYIAPGNAGTAAVGENVALQVNDFDGIADFVKHSSIDMVVVGPEDPLVKGIKEYFGKHSELKQVMLIGPGTEGAQLEGSKAYAKQFMQRHDIPTAAYQSFDADTLAAGQAFLTQLKPPYVLKADGLAAGKGVLIIDDLEEAQKQLAEMLTAGKFGAAGAKVVIEEFLKGIEMSVFVLTDGKSYHILPEAKDYKRIGEGDTGLNTGGMGAISPVPFANAALMQKIEERIVKPTIQGIQSEQIDYTGFVFIGLMIVDEEPYVIEYNVRMGDPETEVVMPRLKSDLLQHLKAAAEGKLSEEKIETDERAATTVMMVSGGYPEAYEKGKAMTGLEAVESSLLFHAGTKMEGDQIVSNGGRVIAITSYGSDFKSALSTSYTNAEHIQFEGAYYRKDIGFDL